MSQRLPLSQAEKERIWRDKLAGRSLAAIAVDLDCSVVTVRKWWRRARDQGQVGLQAPRRGRRAAGVGATFDPQVIAAAIDLKRRHPGWGAKRVVGELRAQPEVADRRLPSPSRLAAIFKTSCPEAVKPTPSRSLPPSAADPTACRP